MNLFSHYKQRENHCTNILMNLLFENQNQLLQPFLQKFVPEAVLFNYSGTQFMLFTEHPPAERKQYEYLIAVAPFPRKKVEEEITANPGSIPDAWIVGENFTMVFEFKISGSIDEEQFAAHRKKLSLECREMVVTWKQIGEFLSGLDVDPTMNWLIGQFSDAILEFESPRQASGMPRQVFSRRRAQPDEPYFVITGNKRFGTYRIEVVLPSEEPRLLLERSTGIMECRRWINRYIQECGNSTIYLAADEAVIDFS